MPGIPERGGHDMKITDISYNENLKNPSKLTVYDTTIPHAAKYIHALSRFLDVLYVFETPPLSF